MRDDYLLRLYTPVTAGAHVFVSDLTARASGWRRSTRSRGGYWRGSFTLTGDVSELAKIFYEYLGYHLSETSGGVETWAGMIYEMELSAGASARRRSLDTMANSVTTLYSYDDGTGKQVTSTSSSADTASIDRYGQREEVRMVAGQPSTAANAARDAYLKEYGWPYARSLGITPTKDKKPQLRVTVCGYIFTANWQFISQPETPAAEDNLSTWIDEIITNSCPFLAAGKIAANTTQVAKQNDIQYLRAWDTITKLLDLGIGSPTAPARAWVYGDRRFSYGAVETGAVYFWRDGELRSSPGAKTSTNPWAVKPGVVRNMDYPVKKTEIGAWLADARDEYIEEVEMGAGFAQPVLKSTLYDESEMMVAQEANKRMLEEQRAKERKHGKG